jgi:pimeloyl-ACP methyl ester carboxylesterase
MKTENTANTSKTSNTSIAQRSTKMLRFKHRDMDYYLSWVMGRAIYDGCETAICASVADKITDGDAASWQREWLAQATATEAQAQALLLREQRNEAHSAFLHACSYTRAALFIMPPSDARFAPSVVKMRACFEAAANLARPRIESVHVPFKGASLAGYFWPADEQPVRRPTLIVVGGIETYAEDCYFMVGDAGRRHGFNVLAVDLPGQGVNPQQGLFFEARMGPSVSAVVDYALGRAEVDASKLALFGFSWGGHIVLKGAQHDSRIKALIANPAMPDVFRAARAQQANHGRGDAIGRMVFEQIAARFGLRLSVAPEMFVKRLAKAYDYLRRGKADPAAIACPTLCLAGEGEAKITLEVAQACHAALPHPQKKLQIFTRADGGEAHCQVDNLALPNGVMFGWLRDVFDCAI